MADTNVVSLIGRLARDMEIFYTSNDTPGGQMKIVVSQRQKIDNDWVEVGHFFDAVMYGQQVETLKPHLIKGRQISIRGELRQDSWEDKDGNKRSKTVILIKDIQLLSKPGKHEDIE